jgi:hypothetical protein
MVVIRLVCLEVMYHIMDLGYWLDFICFYVLKFLKFFLNSFDILLLKKNLRSDSCNILDNLIKLPTLILTTSWAGVSVKALTIL